MTGKETIEILQELWRYKETDKYTDSEIRQALEMAIKALEQKPCTDTVSRQYIESKVEELENICANAPEEVLDLLADIKNAPPVKPKREQGEWIINEEDESIKCPSCGGEFYTWGISTERIKKCPNCGAEIAESEAAE